MIERQGRQPGTRAMVTLIRMGREFGYEKLTAAIEQALDLGCGDVAAIRHLLLSDQLQHTVGEAVDIGSLSAYERPLPTMLEYDRLFSGNVQAVQALVSRPQASLRVARYCDCQPSLPSSPRSLKRLASVTTPTCTISKPCSRPRWKTVSDGASS